MGIIPEKINLNAGGEVELKVSVDAETIVGVTVGFGLLMAVGFALKKL